MNASDKQLFEKALATLETPNNEPLKWLMGEALRLQTAWPEYSHFLLNDLSQTRTNMLVAWNAWIDEYRKLLINPDSAPPRATKDLRSKASEVEDKVRAVAAEVQAVIELKNRGFSEFSVVPPSTIPMPDFEAKFQGKKARIEVKNLREPADHLRVVAAEEWAKQKKANKDRYSFNAILRHDHRGTISRVAESRLRNIIDQFPDMNGPAIETLDGDVEIRLEREHLGNSPRTLMHEQLPQTAEVGRIVIVSAVLDEHLKFNISELQRLFLKVIRVIVSAQPKFFSKETLDPESVNVIALRWESPDIFYHPQTIELTQNRIERLYGDFNLQITVVIFHGSGPEIPLETLRRYK
ncbi:MAG TPA: hypothetical protein VKZ53_17115 [Candidatus Angelobacter sp.]|nr:hypothetical protein [Candidatus Angelobacter sp.]